MVAVRAGGMRAVLGGGGESGESGGSGGSGGRACTSQWTSGGYRVRRVSWCRAVLGGGGESGESGGSSGSGGSGEGGHALEPLKHLVSQWTSGGYDSGDGGHAQAQVCSREGGKGEAVRLSW